MQHCGFLYEKLCCSNRNAYGFHTVGAIGRMGRICWIVTMQNFASHKVFVPLGYCKDVDKAYSNAMILDVGAVSMCTKPLRSEGGLMFWTDHHLLCSTAYMYIMKELLYCKTINHLHISVGRQQLESHLHFMYPSTTTHTDFKRSCHYWFRLFSLVQIWF